MEDDYPESLPLEKADTDTKGSKILFVMPTDKELEAVEQKMSHFKASNNKGSNNQLAPLASPPSVPQEETVQVRQMDAKIVLPPKAGVVKPVPKGINVIKKEAGASSLGPSSNSDAINRKVTAGRVAPSDPDQFFDNPPPPPADMSSFAGKKSRSNGKVYPGGDAASQDGGDDDADKKSTHSKGSRKSADKKSTHSADSWGSGSSVSGRGGKQLSDTRVRKLMFMKDSFVALILLVIFTYSLVLLKSSTGMILPFDHHSFEPVGPIVTILWARATYITTDTAFTKAMSALVGWRLSQKEGYSVAALGFMHSTLMEQLKFTNALSFRSTCKPFLSKLALVNLVHALMLLLTCLTSSAVGTHVSRINKGSLMCILYDQTGIGFPWDRGVPTIVNEMGGAELVDGEALGIVHGSEGSIMHLFSPQLIDVCQDGSTIIGEGFATNVSSQCECSPSSQAADLTTVTGLDSSITTSIAAKAAALGAYPGVVNYIIYDNSTDASAGLIQVLTLLTGSSDICGARPNSTYSVSTSPVPICLTNLTDHHMANLKVTYKTDGTPASIAARKAEYLEYVEKANTWWLHQSMLYLFGSQLSSHELPPYLPGTQDDSIFRYTPFSPSIHHHYRSHQPPPLVCNKRRPKNRSSPSPHWNPSIHGPHDACVHAEILQHLRILLYPRNHRSLDRDPLHRCLWILLRRGVAYF